MKCYNCGSTNYKIEKSPNGNGWCTDCGTQIRKDGKIIESKEQSEAEGIEQVYHHIHWKQPKEGEKILFQGYWGFSPGVYIKLENGEGVCTDMKGEITAFAFWKEVKNKEDTKKLTLTVGLPRSGKSTWAMEQGAPVVNRDSIRMVHQGEAFLPLTESFITVVEDLMVKSLFEAGHNHVIVDATHTTNARRDRWNDIGLPEDVLIEHREFTTSKEECIRRALRTNKPYLVAVIEKMHEQREPVEEE